MDDCNSMDERQDFIESHSSKKKKALIAGMELGELPGRRVGERDGAQCGKLRSAQRQWLGIKAARILSPNTPTHA